MKLCPQCDFIYEDDQAFCDMDGKELVYGPATGIIEQSAAIQASVSTRSQPRRFALAAVAGVAFSALLLVGYFARTHQSRSDIASQSSTQSIPGAMTAQSSTPDLASAPSAALAEPTLPERQLEQSAEQASSPSQNLAPPGLSSSSLSSSSLSPSSAASFRRARLGSSPVSAGGSPGNRAPVIVRLSNGASIKADEAWERKEGIWYRQAGMVTFLKRSRVRAIERPASPQPQSKSGAVNANQRNQKSENFIAQNQPRLGKPEVINVKKESRLSSFLKKTGRILKKPFKF
jgi:hypothetical protein